jgi:hypothetical protein
MRAGRALSSFVAAVVWRGLSALIVAMAVAMLVPATAVVLWPVYDRMGVGAAVIAFTVVVIVRRALSTKQQPS